MKHHSFLSMYVYETFEHVLYQEGSEIYYNDLTKLYLYGRNEIWWQNVH